MSAPDRLERVVRGLHRALKRTLRLLDYFLPREVLMPVIVVFSAENVLNSAFTASVPPKQQVIGWAALMVISILLTAYWGVNDADTNDELDELLDHDDDHDADGDMEDHE